MVDRECYVEYTFYLCIYYYMLQLCCRYAGRYIIIVIFLLSHVTVYRECIVTLKFSSSCSRKQPWALCTRA